MSEVNPFLHSPSFDHFENTFSSSPDLIAPQIQRCRPPHPRRSMGTGMRPTQSESNLERYMSIPLPRQSSLSVITERPSSTPIPE